MNEISIKLQNVSKAFRIYHEKHDTVFSQIVNFRKAKYETLQVLKNISFTVQKGEILGIIGRNGSGKSTLLRIISKILQPDSGDVYVNGTLTPLLQLGTGFNNELSARDNIVLSGLFMGFSKKVIEDKIEEIINFAEVEKFADTKLKHFSSGMYMRLAFAVAIQVEPDILLVDEVLAVGDTFFQQKGLQAFEDYKKRGKTIILVSHDLRTISSFCDRAIYLQNGEIKDIGEPSKVIEEYLKSQ
jgi:ABC-type polysaccharide/polyol phosphate transport system ATPase subunit